MELKEAVCPNCGAKLKVDPSKDAAICEYCGSPFVVEKAIVDKSTNIHIGDNVTFNKDSFLKPIESMLSGLSQKDRKETIYMMLMVIVLIVMIPILGIVSCTTFSAMGG